MHNCAKILPKFLPRPRRGAGAPSRLAPVDYRTSLRSHFGVYARIWFVDFAWVDFYRAKMKEIGDKLWHGASPRSSPAHRRSTCLSVQVQDSHQYEHCKIVDDQMRISAIFGVFTFRSLFLNNVYFWFVTQKSWARQSNASSQ